MRFSMARTCSIPGIFEHIERAGVHSGDSISVYPVQIIGPEMEERIAGITHAIARELGIRGLINIQFVLHDEKLYIIEANPRASRTVPIIQKATGINLVAAATRVALGERLRDMEYGVGLVPHVPYVVVKVPVFSFSKMRGVETILGPEMKSTGEVLGIDDSFGGALRKGFLAAGIRLPGTGARILASIADESKEESIAVLRSYSALGHTLVATPGTHLLLEAAGIASERINKIADGSPHVLGSHRFARSRLGYQRRERTARNLRCLQDSPRCGRSEHCVFDEFRYRAGAGGGARKQGGAAAQPARVSEPRVFILGGNANTLAGASSFRAATESGKAGGIVTARLIPLAWTPRGVCVGDGRQDVGIPADGIPEWIDRTFPAEDDHAFVASLRDIEMLTRIGWETPFPESPRPAQPCSTSRIFPTKSSRGSRVHTAISSPARCAVRCAYATSSSGRIASFALGITTRKSSANGVRGTKAFMRNVISRACRRARTSQPRCSKSSACKKCWRSATLRRATRCQSSTRRSRAKARGPYMAVKTELGFSLLRET